MDKHILIVDDEPQFNVLLTEIFRQAGYGVTAVGSALEGLSVLMENDVDLVVSDYRMPGMTGLEFFDAIHRQWADLPFIMISGYLENATVRELTSKGVGAVFSKPMNVGALMSKTAELLERSPHSRSGRNAAQQGGSAAIAGDTRAKENSPGTPEAPPKPAGGKKDSRAASELPPRSSSFWLFPGKSPRSEAFVRQAKTFTGFSRILSLVGEPGTAFDRIATALVHGGTREGAPVFADARSLSRKGVEETLRKFGRDGRSSGTLVLHDAHELSADRLQDLYAMMEGADNGTLDYEVRFLFCFPKPVDVLYDTGALDEDFYVFLGSNELIVPPLRAMRDDIPELARARLEEIAPGYSLDESAVAYLKSLALERNEADLMEALKAATERSGGRRIGKEHFASPQSGGRTNGAAGAAGGGTLASFLRRRRDALVSAAFLLSGDDVARASKWLKVEPSLLRERLSGISKGPSQ